jgi:hypothetical protein
LDKLEVGKQKILRKYGIPGGGQEEIQVDTKILCAQTIGALKFCDKAALNLGTKVGLAPAVMQI